MTTITREQQKQILIDTANHVISRDNTSPYSENLRELARIALASLEAEPIGYMNCFTGRVFSLDEQPGADTDTAVYEPVYAAPPAPVVSEEMPKGLAGQIVSLLAHNIGDKFLAQKIWNACRAAMLQGDEPVSETYTLPELIEGMEVSIDVSTCDADAGNRYFGTVTEVSELDTARNGYILLVQDAKPNFDVNGNSPVIPDGYALVPVEPTDEMIAAAMNCEDVLFNSDESFCVQFGNIYEAMLAAAPQPEVK
ncbi:hypothetical protein EA500_17295 [Salmonella enterica]|uniref:hypothetical protein n=1 Tax=Salmonella enterica TaxID=28901 RepID=UPI00098E9494|nr:hypothetical protein [Salmonella enterica]EAN3310903.1 hypothetical protein [Salmonella enterica subsp. enterica serovar Give]EDW1156878.1 hypothetical protein [Salmonella enterica subsp. enterica serovar Sundsvall]EAA8413126.1 hypothetical protein [Salmonella enterica subsp. enterica serovar Oranienburg]EAO8006405.1 hypothetical protein [Salmonella enterica subsp. enterica serovar Oranienburg]EAP4105694.1 hypothetical protein [Salmonella enterica subsp. enterica serovar Oranienburg]